MGYAVAWLQNLLNTEENLRAKEASLYKCSGLWLQGYLNDYGLESEVYQEALKYNGTWKPNISAGAEMESNSVILVLTDKRTAFAAEGFVSLLRNMPNVIVVGSNTAGVNLCGEVKTVYLPHSGAGVQFGTALAFRETLENVEGTGIEPDVWVPPEDALERTLTFLSTYKN